MEVWIALLFIFIGADCIAARLFNVCIVLAYFCAWLWIWKSLYASAALAFVVALS